MRAVIWLAVAVWLLTGCVGFGNQTEPTLIQAANVEKIYGRKFELRSMSIDGSPVITHTDAVMTIVFLPKGNIAGFGGVNQFSGTYSFSPEGKLIWGKEGLTITRKSGAPELMEKEHLYLKALRQVTAAVVSLYGLQMESDDGSTKLVFR